MNDALRIEPLGDSALLCTITAPGDLYAAVQRLADAVMESGVDGVLDAAAAYDTLAVYFDPVRTTVANVSRIVTRLGASLPAGADSERHVVTIPLTYDGADLDFVAESTDLTREQVIELHGSVEYTAQAIGFVPGFAYLGDLPEPLRLPRRTTPRTRVPPGAVAIAGRHTAVYPFATAGGWNLIGTTAVVMFDPLRADPALVAVGTRVRFEPT